MGKSTLAKMAFPDFAYVDLEDPQDFARLENNLPFFLKGHSKVIIDEAQHLPNLFPALRSHIDKTPKFKAVLLGSAAPALFNKISEALTGRTSIFELSGISILEHPDGDLWHKGAFPRVHWGRPKIKSVEWYSAYLKTYLAQDIPQLGFRISQVRLRNLMTMIAHSQGSPCNLSELGASLGIKHNSVSHLLDIFEGTFSVRRLQPYFSNLKKRMVKSPKLYIRDTGLLHFILDMGFEKKTLERHPKFGASFETFCIEQIVGYAQLTDPAAQGYFFRTQAGLEVDLILKYKGKLLPIEIKITPPASMRSLENAMHDLGAKRGFIVNANGQHFMPSKGIEVLTLKSFLENL